MNKATIKKRMVNEPWIVREVGKNLVFNREYAAKDVEFTLVPTGRGEYEIRHPSYVFISTVSHFRSAQKDVRLSLNKVYLRSAIRLLQRTGIWASVVNKDFLEVNTNNKKSNKRRVRTELMDLLELEEE